MKLSHLVTILVGVFIIALIAPLSQFLTIMTVNLDLETATPVGWAVGIVFSIILVMAVLRLLRPISGKHSMVILYCMLSISVPVMNLGLVRPFFLSIHAVHREYLEHGTSTYRTAFNVQNEDWFPLVPTKTGLAWNQADRLLRMLRQDDVIQERQEARRRVASVLMMESQRLLRIEQAQEARERAPTQDRIGELQDLARTLPPDEARRVREEADPEAVESLALEDVLPRGDDEEDLPDPEEDEPEQPVLDEVEPEDLSEPAELLVQALEAEADRLETINAGELALEAEPTDEELEQLREDIELLGVDQLVAVREMIEERGAAMREAVERLNVEELLESRYEQTRKASERAAEELPETLAQVSEFAASLLESNYEDLDPDSRGRIDAAVADLTDEQRDWLMAEKAWLREREQDLRDEVTGLSSTDYRSVVDSLMRMHLGRFEEMDQSSFDEVRSSFVYRLTRRERQAIYRQDGTGGRPDHNLAGFNDSLWRTLDDQRQKQREPLSENLSRLRRDLPWHLWLRPMVMWGLLFTCIFLFLMCLAEWLRRKWIERENLAFPLVDIADSIIRHDWEVELAIDPREPPKRRWAFNPTFLMGLGLGLIWVSAEAFGHYGIAGREYIATYNISENVFRTGALREMDGVQLVLSPIIIGIAFLVSLEVSFSVWVLFFVYSLVVLTGRLAADAVPQDSVYTGWAGGRMYPFPMEQMLGAVVAFTSVTLYKCFRLGRRVEQGAADYFIPRRINRIGMLVLPAAILLLLWDMGFSPALTWFLAFFALMVMAQTIAMARVRAETGLPTHHTSYEFTKFPMVFGLTGAMGAKGYALFVNLVFLPVTLLFRTLPQHLENIELARRNKLKYKVIAVAGLVGFLVALTVGMVSFIGFSYYYGSEFYGGSDAGVYEGQGPASQGIAHYPLWVSHFLGEEGLDRFTEPHWIRIYFMIIGAAVLLVLTYLRNRFLRFPFHPLGYMLLLLAIYYEWVSPYFKGGEGVETETSWLWGSVLVAWVVKKLVVKYGGMFAYKRAKPFFIGLVVGAVMCIFLWNCVDLVASISAEVFGDDAPAWFVNPFTDTRPYSPSVY